MEDVPRTLLELAENERVRVQTPDFTVETRVTDVMEEEHDNGEYERILYLRVEQGTLYVYVEVGRLGGTEVSELTLQKRTDGGDMYDQMALGAVTAVTRL